MEPLEKLKKTRAEKLEKIKKLGINPYPAKSDKQKTVSESLKLIGKNVKTAGRIMGIRGHGGSSFADLKDESGTIQLFFSQDKLSTVNRKLLILLDIGDFIEVSGKVDKTQAGQITIFVTDLNLLTKSLRPLPSAWYGLKDVEERNRKRYLDLLINVGVKEVFEQRSRMVYFIRKFLIEEKGYFEVEEPVLQSLYGGTRARPFKTHHNTLETDLYLRISNELYLKRLIVGGFEKVFEMGHTFRNEGMDRNHNPEFTMLETMEAYANYSDNMDLIEEMFEYVAKNVFGKTVLKYQENEIDYKRPWKRIKLADLFKKHTGIHLDEIDTLEKATKLAKKLGVVVKDYMTDGEILLEIFEKKCTTELIQPTFIYDYPADFYPLAKQIEDNPKFVESFDIYVAGMEMGTNYSEQNDPQALRSAWEAEKEKAKAGNPEAQIIDEDFLEALEYGMPPTSGIGPGIDRWVMVMTNTPSISDVILFPTLRPKNTIRHSGERSDSRIQK
jgi:lysyl-tRNA synthetase class 2